MRKPVFLISLVALAVVVLGDGFQGGSLSGLASLLVGNLTVTNSFNTDGGLIYSSGGGFMYVQNGFQSDNSKVFTDGSGNVTLSGSLQGSALKPYISLSYGQGADTTPQDSENFQWFKTAPFATENASRNSSINIRTSHYTAGDHIMEVFYCDDGNGDLTLVAIQAADITIELLYPDTGTYTPTSLGTNMCEVGFNNDTVTFAVASFNQVTFSSSSLTTVYDPGAHWSRSADIYTVPVSGVYRITTKLRIEDYTMP